MQTLYEESKERADRAEQERKEKEALADTHKQLLDYHKQISAHKLDAAEAKYAALKKAHLGLEVKNPWLVNVIAQLQLQGGSDFVSMQRHVSVLEAEVEKYHLLRLQLSLASSPLGPDDHDTRPSAGRFANTFLPNSLVRTKLTPRIRARSSTWHVHSGNSVTDGDAIPSHLMSTSSSALLEDEPTS